MDFCSTLIPFLGTSSYYGCLSLIEKKAGISGFKWVNFGSPEPTNNPQVAAFYKLPSGLWRAQINRHGVRQSATFESKGRAVAWAGQVEAEIMAGHRGEIPNLTLDAVLERYERDVVPQKKGAKWEATRIGTFRRDRIAQVSLRRLDATHVADWRDRRLQVVSGASVRREWNLLSSACSIAVQEWKWLTVNPFKGVKRPSGSKSRTRLASDEELKLLTESASPAMRRVIVFAVETGMRASEIAGLNEVVGSVAYLEDTKNGTRREVPLSKAALEVWEGGFGLTAGSISGLFARLCEEVGIRGLRFHDLRHTACVKLAKKLSLLQLCAMMGWKDPRHALIYFNESAADIAARL
jgi:integrase